MSQRTAIILSLALTLLVGLAIAGNRDRLLGSANSSTDTSTKSSQIEQIETPTTGPAPRIVEITLPVPTAAPVSQSAASSREDDDQGSRRQRRSRRRPRRRS